MAKLPTNLHEGRSDTFRVNPSQLVIDHEFNARWKPMTQDRIQSMAESLIEFGQIEPIQIRKLHGSGEQAVYAVTAGFTRAQAAQLINTDPELRAKTGLPDDKPFTLRAEVANVNEDAALVNNIVENAHRNTTSPVDDAFNHERLRRMGWADVDIAKLYGKTPMWVSAQKKILVLEQSVLEALHDGRLNVAQARDLADLPKEQREETVQVATETEGNRNAINETIQKQQKAQGIKKAPSLKIVKTFLADATKPEVEYQNTRGLHDTLSAFQSYLKGDIDDSELLDKLMRSHASI